MVLWDVATRKRQAGVPLAVNEGRVVAVAFSPDGKTLAAGYGSGLGKPQVDGVALWDVATRKRQPNLSLTASDGSVESLAFSPDGKTLAAGCMIQRTLTGGVVLWDEAERKREADQQPQP